MVQKQDLFPPVNMFGNLYFVGTKPASTHVVDTGEGLIVFDTGYQHSLYAVIDSMYRIGLKLADVKYIVLTHGHIDHLGGARALRDLTGAKIALGAADRQYLNEEVELSARRLVGRKYFGKTVKVRTKSDQLLVNGYLIRENGALGENSVFVKHQAVVRQHFTQSRFKLFAIA